MPSTKHSPVKLLSDLGIDVMNLSSQEDYKSALIEGLAKLQYTGETSSERFKILTDEVLRVKREKLKAENPTYTTKEERPEVKDPLLKAKKTKITGADIKRNGAVGSAEKVASSSSTPANTSQFMQWHDDSHKIKTGAAVIDAGAGADEGGGGTNNSWVEGLKKRIRKLENLVGGGGAADAGAGVDEGDKETNNSWVDRLKERIRKLENLGGGGGAADAGATGAKIDAASMKKDSSVGMAEAAVPADTTGTSAIVPSPGGELADPVPQPSPIPDSLTTVCKDILASVNRIKESLIDSGKAQQAAADDERIAKEQKKRSLAEKGLETITSAVTKAADTVLKPFKNIFLQIIQLIATVFFGRVLMKVIDWFSDKKNFEKISTIFKFLKQWWPVLVAGAMLFLGPLLGKLGMIAGTIALLTWGIPKIINAVKSIFGFGKDVDKELEGLDKSADKDAKDLVKGIEKDTPADMPKEQKQEQTPSELKPAEDRTKEEANREPEKMNKGGVVPGKGNTDTVPAKLTPGEFVMSKGAVEKYGVDTLAGMNAAGGGTNKSVNGGYSGGGPVKKDGDVNVDNSVTNKQRIEQIKAGPVTTEAKKELRELGVHPIGIDLWAKRKNLKTKLQGVSPGGTGGQWVKGGGAIGSDGKWFNNPMLSKQPVQEGSLPSLSGGGPMAAVKDIMKKVSGGGVHYHKVLDLKGEPLPMQISKSQLEKPPINPPSKPKVTQAYKKQLQSKASGDTIGTSTGTNIPDFDAGAMISVSKIRTLGITV